MDICRRFYYRSHRVRSQESGVRSQESGVRSQDEEEGRKKKKKEEKRRKKKNSFHQSPIPNPQSPVSNYKLMGNTL